MASVSRIHRDWIEAEINLHLDRVSILIARLDRLDGDCDVEEDDPSGDPIDIQGEAPSDDGAMILPFPAIYGVDQRRSPLNRRQAERAYLAQLEAN